MIGDPAILRVALALPPWLDREWRMLAVTGAVSWDGRSGWRAMCSPTELEVFEAVEAAGWWSPPGERRHPGGDDPLRAGPARPFRRG